MTSVVERVERAELKNLISFLNPDDMEIINRWVYLSPSIWSGMVDGKLLCVWGLIPPTMLSDQAYLWLIVTEAAQEHEFILVRRSQIEMKKMLKQYPRIVGHCEATEARSIRWLAWLGAIFGPSDGRLIPFVIRGA